MADGLTHFHFWTLAGLPLTVEGAATDSRQVELGVGFRFNGVFNDKIGLYLTSRHTHTHPFNGPLSRTTRVSRYQKVKTSLDFTEARDSEWQWHQLGHMQVCTLLQTDNHASTSLLSFYRPDALPAAQPTASKH